MLYLFQKSNLCMIFRSSYMHACAESQLRNRALIWCMILICCFLLVYSSLQMSNYLSFQYLGFCLQFLSHLFSQQASKIIGDYCMGDRSKAAENAAAIRSMSGCSGKLLSQGKQLALPCMTAWVIGPLANWRNLWMLTIEDSVADYPPLGNCPSSTSYVRNIERMCICLHAHVRTCSS